ncbi:MAG: DUF429 domain-containing protein [Cyanobacteria bacterium HKST-UBA02]|nr:DUF429 domain-containing protein [Cyanobacteria bacterium HKST-UBA02]
MSVLVAGADFSGAAKIPNDTWLVTGTLGSLGLEINSVKNPGSHALTSELKALPELKCAALDFPFSLPTEFLRFTERKLDIPEYQQWQQVAEQLVFMSWEQFEALVLEYDIEPKRFTDKKTARAAQSPLHRVNPSMIQMTYHGIRLLAMLDPAKFSVLPFQDRSPGATPVIEVYPREILYLLGLPDRGYKGKEAKNHEQRREIVDGLLNLRERGGEPYQTCPRLTLDKSLKGVIVANDHALDALIACYAAALFVASAELFPDPLDADNLNVLLEGWIFAPTKLRSH